MPQVVVEMTSNEAQAWAGIQRLVRGTGDFEAGLSKTKKAAKEAADEQAKLEKAAVRVFEETRTPQERYLARMQDLETLLQKGKVSQETYGRAVGQAGQELSKAEEAARKAGEATKGAFGTDALKSIANYAATLTGIGSTLAFVQNTLSAMSEARERASQQAIDSEMDLGQLAQVADSPEHYQKLVGAAKATFAKGGAKTLGQAASLVFSLESAGIGEELPLFSDMAAAGLVKDPAVMARSAKTLMASMGGEETGSYRQIIPKAFAAGKYTPGTAERLLEASARAGTGARAMKLSDEEVLAATAITSEAAGSEEIAGTQMSSLMRSLRKMGAGATGGSPDTGPQESLEQAVGKKVRFDFGGKSLVEMLHQVQGAKLNDEQLFKVFGRQEAVKAYETILLNEKRYGQALDETRKAQTSDEVAAKLAYAQTLPAQAASRAKREAEAARDVAAEPLGITKNIADAVQAHYERRVREGTAGQWLPAEWDIGLQKATNAATGWMPGRSEEVIREGIYQGHLEDNPKLLRQAVESLGGPDQVFTHGDYWMPGRAKKRYEELTADVLKDIRDNTRRAAEKAGGGTALGHPDVDR